MKRFLGKYQLGSHTINVYTDENGCNGSFNFRNDLPEMIVGMGGNEQWWQVLEVLLHEALELSFSQNLSRLLPDIKMSDNSDAYIFLCNHSSFSEIVAQTANFMSQCIPDLADRFDKRRKRNVPSESHSGFRLDGKAYNNS
jgi:hypothetical protein